MNKKVNTKQTIPYIMLIAIIAVVLIMFSFSGSTVKELTYDELITEFSKGNVTEIVTSERSAAGYYQITGKLKNYKKVSISLQKLHFQKLLQKLLQLTIQLMILNGQ